MSEYKFRVAEVAGKTIEVPQHWSDNAAKILATKYFKRAGVPTQMLGFLAVKMPMDLDAATNWGTNVETIVRAIIIRQPRLWPDVDTATLGGEYSAHHVFLRLVLTWAHFGVRYGQIPADSTEILKFINELYDDLFWQRAAPNSPQWFNTGLYYVYGISNPASGAYYIGEDGEIREVTDAYERPQAGACFIQKIEDSLDGILDFSVREARLFRHGSGSGANVSSLRGENEPLSGGGVSSGLLSFLDIHDTVAGAIKSGGTTRRAAKMVTLDADHPDVEGFIDWKAKEELKVRALVEGSRVLREAGVDIEQFDSNWEGAAYRTVSGQNSNNSIMVKDEFMQLATNGDYETDNWPLIGRVSKKPIKYVNAAGLLRKIATAAWKSGDPALQFWGAINRANPTNEEFHATNPCLAGDTLIATSEGLKRIDALLDAPFQVVCGDGVLREVAPAFFTGIKPVMRLEFADGNFVHCTLDHLIKTVSGHDVEAHKLHCGDGVVTLDGTTTVTAVGYYGDVIKVYDITEPVTHHFFANNICVHNCSEYVFVDDSACNLASINLCQAGWLAFAGGVGDKPVYFDDAIQFADLVGRWTRVLDITVDMSQYPSRAIATNSRDYRPLGLGYANLGAYLMRQGLAYDSDAARLQIRVITRFMTRCAAEESAHLASILGPYPKYDRVKHGEVFNRVLNHGSPRFPETVSTQLRNAQLTLLAPCGTIGFVMDCDTTGIEPDFSLVKFKQLAGGGYMNIINQSVELALSSLGYEPDDIDRIKHYLMEEVEVNGSKAPRNTLEGCPGLRPEHLPVFDCATAGGGTRSISWRGHLEAMAAAQPYLNGAISKTVNMPAESTIEDMEAAYVAAWKMGLKAVALYRDGSKNSQPLTTGASKQTSPADVTPPAHTPVRARRESLPNKRKGYTQKLDVGGQKVYLRTGEYTDGRLGEIFIDVARQGDTTRSLMNAVAVALSIGLQHGVPLGEYIDAFIGSKFEPNGVVRGHDSITMASSLLDAIVRDLELNYEAAVDPLSWSAVPAENTPAPIATFNDMAEERELARRRGFEDAVCTTCQSRTLVRNGACMKCVTCGNTTGCS